MAPQRKRPIRITRLQQIWANSGNNFIPKKFSKKISDKEGDEVFAIYTDYESDYTGRYTAIIGQRVHALNNIPDGLVGREIKNEKLLKYIAKGEMPAAIIETWQEIWSNDSTLNRTYVADFEVYEAKSQQGATSEVEVYIGVR